MTKEKSEKNKPSSLPTHLGSDFEMGLISRAVNDRWKYYPESLMMSFNRFPAGEDKPEGDH